MVSSLQHTANLTNFWGFELLQINMKLHGIISLVVCQVSICG